jgi:hypothetical protein
MEQDVQTKGLITIGHKFTSIQFDGECTIIGCDVRENALKVRIERTDDKGQIWHRNEDWNLEHTVFGFENGDYTKI